MEDRKNQFSHTRRQNGQRGCAATIPKREGSHAVDQGDKEMKSSCARREFTGIQRPANPTDRGPISPD
jgi:hypothetical protein